MDLEPAAPPNPRVFHAVLRQGVDFVEVGERSSVIIRLADDESEGYVDERARRRADVERVA